MSTKWIVLLVIAGLWDFIWKALALWKSAQRKEVAWFVFILVFNSVGILPIAYLLLTKKPKK